MGFVEREIERVQTKLQSAGPLAEKERSQLYAVQQALLWTQSPDSFKSPYDMIMPTSDTQQAVGDCLAENGHSPSSDNLDCHVS
jgi:hypothetical protein